MILSKRPNLMIRKLSEMLVPRRNRSSPIKQDDNHSASPRSPLDLKFPSPVNSNRFDSRGVGLGIVAALEETSIGINRVDLSNEEYTFVTSLNGPTKVYYNEDGFELCEKEHRRVQKSLEQPPVIKRESCRNQTEFLSSCCLCKKKLQGKDIYMYKGEMGFCSVECRSVQIMNEERQEEQCKTQVSRNVDVSSSNNNTAGESFSTGIFVF